MVENDARHPELTESLDWWVFWSGLKHDILSRENILNKDFDQGISFPRQTRTATESRVTTIACGERPRPSTTVTSARELMPTGFFATISILRLQLLTTTSSHRNWDFHWSETGASGDSCSQTYYGPEPFSEVKASLIRTWDFPYLSFLRQVENRNVRDFVSARKDRIVFYQTLHSYSQLILFPW